MRSKNNVKPEAGWSQMRRQFTPGFEDILDHGLNNGIYNPDIAIERFGFVISIVAYCSDSFTGFFSAGWQSHGSRQSSMHAVLLLNRFLTLGVKRVNSNFN
jgi:hypothetical protein